MKTISLKEPYATLIKSNIKKIETRSWKTNYRGELYIHASISKISKEIQNNNKLMSLVTSDEYSYSKIICKCNLVDCIYMDEKFVDKIKKENPTEYICGLYQVGRYAWILENIEQINKKIEAKGSLGIWNYYNEFEIMDKLEEINYGYTDSKGNIHNDTNYNNYLLQSPNQIIKSKVGLCWDQVELERYYFKPWNNIKTYFIRYYDFKNNNFPTHTFLTYEKDNEYYWFEHSFIEYKGIHKYKTNEELLIDVTRKFIEKELNNKCNKDNVVIREYKKPKYNISDNEFIKHCENNEPIEIRW